MTDYTGTDQNDRLTGGSGNDRFEGLGGNDTLKGGGGVDTAVFSGSLYAYSWSATNKGWQISGPDGTDNLESIEVLEFADLTFSLTGNNAPSASIPTVSTDVDTIIQFEVTGADLDDPNFGLVVNDDLTFQQPVITQISFTHVPTADGRTTSVTYQLDPTRIPASIADPLAEGEAYVIPVTVVYGSVYQGFQNFTSDVIVYGKNDNPGMFGSTLYATEDAGPARFDLSTVADDPDSDDDGTTLTYEIVSNPAGLDVTIDGSDLVFDPLDGYQILVENQFAEETIQIRAVDRHGAVSETVDFTLSIEGANDPRPDYQNPNGSPDYTAIGLDPATLPNLGVLSGLVNDPDNLTYTQHSDGDDVLAIRAQAFGFFEEGSFFYEQNNLPWNDLSIDMGAGNDLAVIKLDNASAEMTQIELNMGSGENLVVIDIDATTYAVFDSVGIFGGDNSSQVIIDIDSSGSVRFIDADFGFGDGNDLLHVMITATGAQDAFPFQTTANFVNSYSMGGGNDTVILDFDVTDGGEIGFSDSIYAWMGDDHIRIDNLDSTISAEFPSSGQMGFTGLIDASYGDDVIDFFWRANTGESANGTIRGGLGADTLNLWGNLADWTVVENTDTWSTFSNGGQSIEVIDVEIINAQDGTFTPVDQNGFLPVLGTTGNDSLIGGDSADNLKGYAGNDTLRGDEGDDLIEGGDDTDQLRGDAGHDTLIGGLGNDSLYGGTGHDLLQGEEGENYLVGDDGNDSIFGGAARDIAYGMNDHDYIDLGGGSNFGFGGAGNDTVIGGEGADTIDGDDGSDSLEGGGGNDRLQGGDNDDHLNGGLGSDSLFGGWGFDTASYQDAATAISASLTAPGANTGEAAGDIYTSIESLFGSAHNDTLAGDFADNSLSGHHGNDTLRGDTGDDTVDGGDGHDRLEGGSGLDHLIGGDGNDTAFGGGTEADTIDGGRGTDLLFGEQGNDLMHGGDGFDNLRGGGGDDTIDGGNGNDGLFGGTGNDSLIGNNGNDTLYGGPSGNDILLGGANNDLLFGEAGKDYLQGDDGDDTLNGGANDDTLLGGNGDDSLEGGAGNDSLFGGPEGADTLKGGQGSDFLFAESADDVLDGGDGFDLLNGGAGNDSMTGGNGNDRLEGNLGSDTLDGGAGDDTLFGGNGDFSDTLIGGSGNDTMSGEGGADIFVFDNGFGQDVVTDFDAFSAAEKIDLSRVTAITDFADLTANHLDQNGADAVITDGINTITLNNVLVADLGADDFEFVLV